MFGSIKALDLRDAHSFGRVVVGWSGLFPLIFLLSSFAGLWLLAAHYYDLPVIFFAHFLYAVGGFAFMWKRVLLGRWLAGAGSIFALASTVAAISIIHMIAPLEDSKTATVLIRAALYLIHGLYFAGNVWIAVTIFKIPRPKAT